MRGGGGGGGGRGKGRGGCRVNDVRGTQLVTSLIKWLRFSVLPKHANCVVLRVK